MRPASRFGPPREPSPPRQHYGGGPPRPRSPPRYERRSRSPPLRHGGAFPDDGPRGYPRHEEPRGYPRDERGYYREAPPPYRGDRRRSPSPYERRGYEEPYHGVPPHHPSQGAPPPPYDGYHHSHEAAPPHGRYPEEHYDYRGGGERYRPRSRSPSPSGRGGGAYPAYASSDSRPRHSTSPVPPDVASLAPIPHVEPPPRLLAAPVDVLPLELTQEVLGKGRGLAADRSGPVQLARAHGGAHRRGSGGGPAIAYAPGAAGAAGSVLPPPPSPVVAPPMSADAFAARRRGRKGEDSSTQGPAAYEAYLASWRARAVDGWLKAHGREAWLRDGSGGYWHDPVAAALRLRPAAGSASSVNVPGAIAAVVAASAAAAPQPSSTPAPPSPSATAASGASALTTAVPVFMETSPAGGLAVASSGLAEALQERLARSCAVVAAVAEPSIASGLPVPGGRYLGGTDGLLPAPVTLQALQAMAAAATDGAPASPADTATFASVVRYAAARLPRRPPTLAFLGLPPSLSLGDIRGAVTFKLAGSTGSDSGGCVPVTQEQLAAAVTAAWGELAGATGSSANDGAPPVKRARVEEAPASTDAAGSSSSGSAEGASSRQQPALPPLDAVLALYTGSAVSSSSSSGASEPQATSTAGADEATGALFAAWSAVASSTTSPGVRLPVPVAVEASDPCRTPGAGHRRNAWVSFATLLDAAVAKHLINGTGAEVAAGEEAESAKSLTGKRRASGPAPGAAASSAPLKGLLVTPSDPLTGLPDGAAAGFTELQRVAGALAAHPWLRTPPSGEGAGASVEAAAGSLPPWLAPAASLQLEDLATHGALPRAVAAYLPSDGGEGEGWTLRRMQRVRLAAGWHRPVYGYSAGTGLPGSALPPQRCMLWPYGSRPACDVPAWAAEPAAVAADLPRALHLAALLDAELATNAAALAGATVSEQHQQLAAALNAEVAAGVATLPADAAPTPEVLAAAAGGLATSMETLPAYATSSPLALALASNAALTDLQRLDAALLYLRAAHAYDYYSGVQGASPGDLRMAVGDGYRRCPVRTPRADKEKVAGAGKAASVGEAVGADAGEAAQGAAPGSHSGDEEEEAAVAASESDDDNADEGGALPADHGLLEEAAAPPSEEGGAPAEPESAVSPAEEGAAAAPLAAAAAPATAPAEATRSTAEAAARAKWDARVVQRATARAAGARLQVLANAAGEEAAAAALPAALAEAVVGTGAAAPSRCFAGTSVDTPAEGAAGASSSAPGATRDGLTSRKHSGLPSVVPFATLAPAAAALLATVEGPTMLGGVPDAVFLAGFYAASLRHADAAADAPPADSSSPFAPVNLLEHIVRGEAGAAPAPTAAANPLRTSCVLCGKNFRHPVFGAKHLHAMHGEAAEAALVKAKLLVRGALLHRLGALLMRRAYAWDPRRPTFGYAAAAPARAKEEGGGAGEGRQRGERGGRNGGGAREGNGRGRDRQGGASAASGGGAGGAAASSPATGLGGYRDRDGLGSAAAVLLFGAAATAAAPAGLSTGVAAGSSASGGRGGAHHHHRGGNKGGGAAASSPPAPVSAPAKPNYGASLSYDDI